MSYFNDASLVLLAQDLGKKAGSVAAQKPMDANGQMTFTRTGDTATRVGPNGLIEPVLANIARIDYTGGGCGKLLLEPQRTNLATYSEQFDNAAWGVYGGTITPNVAVSPDGSTNADTLAISSGGYIIQTLTSYSAVTGQKITISVFAKNQTADFLIFGGASLDGTDVYSIESYGNGWYRHMRVRTFTTTATGSVQYLVGFGIIGTHFIWGAQIEGSNSAYATSYIPTLSAAVTRGADACYKNSLSVFGTNVGSFFVDAEGPFYNGVPAYFFDLSDNSSSAVNRIGVYVVSGNEFILYTNVGTSFTVSATSRKKIAVVWSGANIKLYLNGAKVVDITYANANPTSINLNSRFTEAEYGNSKFNQVLTFPTALSDSQCIELTTI
jgi:hypothetical protein